MRCQSQEEDPDYEPAPENVIGAGVYTPNSGDTALEVVESDDFATGFRQPSYGDAWWVWARRDGCFEVGRMENAKYDGGIHGCDINQLIVILFRARDYMIQKHGEAYGD